MLVSQVEPDVVILIEQDLLVADVVADGALVPAKRNTVREPSLQYLESIVSAIIAHSTQPACSPPFNSLIDIVLDVE